MDGMGVNPSEFCLSVIELIEVIELSLCEEIDDMDDLFRKIELLVETES